MDHSLSTTIGVLTCFFVPGIILALIYSLIFQRRRLASIPMDYQIAVMTREHKIQFEPALLRILLLLLGAAILLLLFLSGTGTIGAVAAIIIWLLMAVYLFFHLFKIPRIHIDPQEKVIEIGRKSTQKLIPFTDLKGILFSSSRQFRGRSDSFDIQIVLKNDTKIDLGRLSGRKRNERRQQIQTWLKEARLPFRVV
jgi:hypothetical protein